MESQQFPPCDGSRTASRRECRAADVRCRRRGLPREFVAFLDEHLPTDAEALRAVAVVVAHAGLGPALAALAVRQRLAGAGQPAGVRRPQRDDPAAVRALRRSCPGGAWCTASTRRASASSPRRCSPSAPPEQQQQVGGADPARRDHRGARHERAGCRIRPGVAAHHARSGTATHFVVNGQKVWTSGAHDADVLLTFVRTDPDAPKHKGISVLLIPTDSPGVTRRPFASACDRDDLDFNEVFFADVRVPAENLVGAAQRGLAASPTARSGHERTMLWLSYADRLRRPDRGLRPDHRARAGPLRDAGDGQPGAAAARLGGAGPRRPRRGGRAGLSVLKLLGARPSGRHRSTRWPRRAPTG